MGRLAPKMHNFNSAIMSLESNHFSPDEPVSLYHKRGRILVGSTSADIVQFDLERGRLIIV